MRDPLTNFKFRSPLVAFADVLAKEQGGAYMEQGDFSPFIFRALVYAVDTDGGKLENPEGSKVKTKTLVASALNGGSNKVEEMSARKSELENPAHSVKARIVGRNIDSFVGDEDLRVYWPLFPGVFTVTAGDLVYVTFEDYHMVHGLWLAKVPVDRKSGTPRKYDE